MRIRRKQTSGHGPEKLPNKDKQSILGDGLLICINCFEKQGSALAQRVISVRCGTWSL
jgi:hypothetical protein